MGTAGRFQTSSADTCPVAVFNFEEKYTFCWLHAPQNKTNVALEKKKKSFGRKKLALSQSEALSADCPKKYLL